MRPSVQYKEKNDFVPDQVRTLSQVGTSSHMAYAMRNCATSSNMAQKVLTWSNSQLTSRCSFHVPCLFFVLYMYSRIRFRYQRCDIYVNLHMIYKYMLRMAVLDRICGWFYYVFYKR